jgi:hypothetical protein
VKHTKEQAHAKPIHTHTYIYSGFEAIGRGGGRRRRRRAAEEILYCWSNVVLSLYLSLFLFLGSF